MIEANTKRKIVRSILTILNYFGIGAIGILLLSPGTPVCAYYKGCTSLVYYSSSPTLLGLSFLITVITTVSLVLLDNRDDRENPREHGKEVCTSSKR